MNRLTLALAALILTGCSLIPKDGKPDTFIAKRASMRRACEQALEIGWCYDGCRHKPAKCCEPKNVRCSPDGMCIWEGCDGELIFGVGGVADTAPMTPTGEQRECSTAGYLGLPARAQ